MTIKKIGPNRYYLDVAVRGVGRKRQTLNGTIYQARERVGEIKKEIRAKRVTDRSLTFSTVGDVLTYYWEEHFQYKKSAKIFPYLFETLKEELGPFKLPKFSAEVFESWLRKKGSEQTQYKRVPRPESLNKYITMAKAAFNFLVKRERLEKSPLRFVKHFDPKNIQRRVLSLVEFKKLYLAAPDYLKPFLEFIYKHPCRKMEVLGLRNPEDLNLFKGVLNLPDERSKTGEGRQLFIPESMMEYFKKIPAESPWVFFRPEKLVDGTVYFHPLKPTGVLQAVKRAAERAGLKEINIHLFRRTSAVNLLTKGVDVKTLSLLGGWKDYRMLFKRYLPLSDNDLKAAMERVDVDLNPRQVDTFVDTPPQNLPAVAS